MSILALQRPRLILISLSIEAIALGVYLVRDAFGGVIRYYTSIYHMDALWYLPDAVALACLIQFIVHCILRNRSTLALLVLVQIMLSLVLGYFMMGTANAAISSFKMMLPVFVGFCFCDASLGSYKKLLSVIAVTFYLSVIGVLLTKFYLMPWVGYKYESFGAVREAGRLWWAYGGDDQRLMGFAADNTMAAFFILVSFAITSIRKSTTWCLLFGSLAVYVIKLTTSKTTMIVLVLYLILLVFVRMLPEKSRFPAIRGIAQWSFAAIFVPFFMIVIASGTAAVPHSTLFSIVDRINNSWQLPFVYMNQLMPIGLVTGCGAGCFNYPQKLFSPLAHFWVPVDNFYIGTYLMFGLPFVAFMVMVFRATFGATDVYKLTLIFVVNLFTITVLNYGPASGLLIIALSFSDVFSRRAASARAGDAVPIVMRPPMPSLEGFRPDIPAASGSR
ncbi:MULTISPECIES: hypothetical protein [Bradyrhizobium]|uniref:Uncharacterized protein n=1 Tax=Bradyrhizobium ottawaense TaxID=931866 RepID=A0A2U8P011_9BRAD|nr:MULTISPECIES: hypothetical protein [Bradyrhizobium]AWL91008.1 hypothetical protein CIT37_00795 [Bradyrhizobium ottawaense]MBR1287769.1 hypothetical protein [Bradyrhizobium ottawaense]MBR1364881.1 hypothetical protein [Bradyrhizobium ottawaense]MDA9418847.1 hypothetical protein [Bradyrhizobium sp. CCBAU 25360]MDA9479245.1 hypothetical protein [Bradyrhizobium sp. CCBAU 65884]